MQQQGCIRQRHIARGNAFDGFNDIAGGKPRLGGRRSGNGAHHADIAEALREDQSNVTFVPDAVLLVFLVLIGVEIAGEGVDGFEQPI